ncbi:MAG: bifunctional oligoribonuclease/PAP phosphatase NrnA [Candidatus Omnitrophica bacterium]|nr:bifunctional oligoribonuclease/PAP phosphatase NrnA [Candidatus Omnitrophota bacterium]
MSRPLDEICRLIRRSRSFAITSHIAPDGDGVGSMFSMAALLKGLGKKVTVVCDDAMPERYRFLGKTWVRTKDAGSLKPDCMITMECPVLTRVGHTIKIFRRAKYTINIDHHPGNDEYATVNWVNVGAAATGEMIYELFKKMHYPLDQETARLIYISILTDTGSFRYANTTRRTHAIAGELIQYGVQPDRLMDEIYESNTYRGMRLLGRALSTLRRSPDKEIAWLAVTSRMLKESCAKSEDADGFVNFARNLRGTKVACFFLENNNGEVKVSLRSKRSIDVNQVAAAFGGGGHKAASGCQVKGRLAAVEKEVIAKIRMGLDDAR